MADHDVTLEIPRVIEVGNVDIKIRVKRNGSRFGTLTISKGSIDWRPLKAKSGKKGETQSDLEGLRRGDEGGKPQ